MNQLGNFYNRQLIHFTIMQQAIIQLGNYAGGNYSAG